RGIVQRVGGARAAGESGRWCCSVVSRWLSCGAGRPGCRRCRGGRRPPLEGGLLLRRTEPRKRGTPAGKARFAMEWGRARGVIVPDSRLSHPGCFCMHPPVPRWGTVGTFLLLLQTLRD